MLVKDLRKFLSDEKPSDMSEEEYDNLEVLVYAVDGELYSPAESNSGVCQFEGICDENGNEIITDDPNEGKIPAFVLFPDYKELMNEEAGD